MDGRRNTHPLVLGAAASVLFGSLIGAAALGGLLPNSDSDKIDAPVQAGTTAANGALPGAPALAVPDDVCASCGTVKAVHALQFKGDATGLGAVAGAVTRNETEKNTWKRYSYRVTVQMDDGSLRTISQSAAPAVATGDRVRIANGALVARS